MAEEFIHDPVETGFDLITAAVNQAAPELTEEGRDALKALLAFSPDHLSPQFLAGVARDLAMDIHTLDAVLTNHGLTHAQYDFLATHNEFFKHVLAQQIAEWHKIGSTQDRLKAQAAAALEAQLPVLAGRMGKLSEKLSDTVEAAKLFAKIAGVDAPPPGARAGGEGFTINIDLGADQRITVRSGSDPAEDAKPVGAAPLLQVAKAA